MKSKIESGAKRRAVVSASAVGRREVASVGREIEREEVASGYAVMLGVRYESSGERYSVYLSGDGKGEVSYPSESVITDYADACAKCAAVIREDKSAADKYDFPAPEFPRVVYVRLSASVVGVA